MSTMPLESIINSATTLQDIELATAIQMLKDNPGQLQSFLQKQQDNVYKSITDQKKGTFEKVYGDVKRAHTVQDSVLRYYARSKELSDLRDNVYINQKDTADSEIHNNTTFKRKYEMNEWSVGNKKDTLFVFSALFVLLSVIVFATAFLRMHVISSMLWATTSVISTLIFILIVVNRSQYTDLLRNKKYWNKKNFGGKYGTIPIPSICPDPAPATPATVPTGSMTAPPTSTTMNSSM